MGTVRIVRASAGSGKTYKLAYEYVRNVITDPERYRHILAVTFTNKATGEMKQRILAKLDTIARCDEDDYLSKLVSDTGFEKRQIQQRAREVRNRILHDYSRFDILTIDKFFQRIIRSFLHELGVDLNYTLELQTDTLLGNAADAVVEQAVGDASLRGWLIGFLEERIDEGRSWNIQGDLMRLGKELFRDEYRAGMQISATRQTLGKVMGHARAEARRLGEELAGQAAAILKLLGQHGLSALDLAYGANGIGGYLERTARGTLAEPSRRMRDAAASETAWYSKNSPKRDAIEALAPQLRQLADTFCRTCTTALPAINSAMLLGRNYRNFALLGDLYMRMQEICTQQGIVPISETNHMLARLVAGNDAPFIFEKAGSRYTHFMIDEFQDTSLVQWENFLPLLRNAAAQSTGTPVLLVGDVKQSIYRWRGGDWRILASGAQAQFRETATEPLDTNYRSLGGIVQFNNVLTGAAVEADNARLENRLSEAVEAGRISASLRDELSGMLAEAYRGHAQQPADPGQGGYVTITYYNKDETGRAIPPLVERIVELRKRGYRAGDIAVLVRTNDEGAAAANQLLAYKHAFPDSPWCCDVVTQDALAIGAAPVCGFIAACMHLAEDRQEPVQRAVYNNWLGRPFQQPLPAAEKEFLYGLKLCSPQEAFEALAMRFRLGDNAADTSYLQAFHQQVITFCNTRIADLPLFLQWWEENGAGQSLTLPEGTDSVTITTIHKSKGLDYPVVLLPYCNWRMTTRADTILWADASGTPYAELGRIPVGYCDQMADSYFAPDYYRETVLSHTDNMNLFYVALTRARREIHLMIPEAKTRQGIDALIDASITLEHGQAVLGAMTGTVTETENGKQIAFGQPTEPSGTGTVLAAAPPPFTTTDPSARLTLRLPGQRYTEEGAHAELTPRNFGVLMHRVFEYARNESDIRAAAVRLRDEGTLSAGEADLLQDRIDSALCDPRVHEWFCGAWDHVYTENELLVPGSGVCRPDRVMVRGTEAVVVDYKFGQRRQAAHRTQLEHYRNLLASMGYTQATAYLWYVNLDEIESL